MRFGGWRRRLPAEYRSAFVAESLPALLRPFVEVELAEWPILGLRGYLAEEPNRSAAGAISDGGGPEGGGPKGGDPEGGGPEPLPPTVFPLTDQAWVGELADYGVDDPGGINGGTNGGTGGGGASSEGGGGADAELVPRLVALTVCPRLASALEASFDPFSARESAFFAGAAAELLDFGLDPHGAALAPVLAAPLAAFRRASARLAVPVPSPFLDRHGEASGAARALSLGQLWHLAKLLGCLKPWLGLVDPAASGALVVEELLEAKAAPALSQLIRLGACNGDCLRLALALDAALPRSPSACGWGPAIARAHGRRTDGGGGDGGTTGEAPALPALLALLAATAKEDGSGDDEATVARLTAKLAPPLR